jgi:hypothetical protein
MLAINIILLALKVIKIRTSVVTPPKAKTSVVLYATTLLFGNNHPLPQANQSHGDDQYPRGTGEAGNNGHGKRNASSPCLPRLITRSIGLDSDLEKRGIQRRRFGGVRPLWS